MKRVWAKREISRQGKTPLQTFLHHLLIDVIPALLLLAAMAYGMALVSHKMAEPRSVEIQVVPVKMS